MVHHSLGQVLIRQEWKAFLPNMGLNKFVRVTSAPRPIPKADNSFLGRGSSLPQYISQRLKLIEYYFQKIYLIIEFNVCLYIKMTKS